jgi:hypothetical protein
VRGDEREREGRERVCERECVREKERKRERETEREREMVRRGERLRVRPESRLARQPPCSVTSLHKA